MPSFFIKTISKIKEKLHSCENKHKERPCIHEFEVSLEHLITFLHNILISYSNMSYIYPSLIYIFIIISQFPFTYQSHPVVVIYYEMNDKEVTGDDGDDEIHCDEEENDHDYPSFYHSERFVESVLKVKHRYR